MLHNFYDKRYLILNMIHHLGPISRIELINMTDYRPASVGEIIKELLDENLIIETGYASSGPGRKRIMLELNKSCLCAMGLSFSAHHVNYIVSQIDGTILYQNTEVYHPEDPKEMTIEIVVKHVEEILIMFRDKKILGVGISDPLYDPTSYQLTHTLQSNYTHYNDWVKLELKSRIEAIAHVPVENYGGVAMPVMAEQKFGIAKGKQDFICVELSNGIGSSICCNGMPVTGAIGRAAELGHMVINYDSSKNQMCYCGKPGCIEESTSLPALKSKIKAALKKGVFSVLNSKLTEGEDISVSMIKEALEENDKMCMHYVKVTAVYLGVAIANAINLLNPEMVVLYGSMVELGDFFLQQLELSIRENSLSLVSDFKVCVSECAEMIYCKGAVAEIFSSYLMQDRYKWIYQMDREQQSRKEITDGE